MTETSKQMQYTETANIPLVDMPSCGHSMMSSISGFTSKEMPSTYTQQMFTRYKQPHI